MKQALIVVATKSCSNSFLISLYNNNKYIIIIFFILSIIYISKIERKKGDKSIYTRLYLPENLKGS